jgi:phosphinothricin acetyltransferase
VLLCPCRNRARSSGDLEIYNHAIAHTTAVFQYHQQTLDSRLEWFRAKQADAWPVLVADEGGGVRGFATYGPFRAWPAYKYTVEHSVYVAEEARGRGIGASLVGAVVDEARTRDLHAVIAGIVATNTASLRLHQALGFVEVAHFREVGYKFGQWLDLKFLQLLLHGPRTPVEP